MNAKNISQLSEIIFDKWNRIDSRENIKLRINRIFGRKKISTIVKELEKYKINMSDDQKRDFPFSVLIVVLAIIIRNLDCIDGLQRELEIRSLINPLYGGMYKLLCGNSQKMCINIEWSENSYKNKYEFLNRFHEFKYWDYIEIFQISIILFKSDKEKFEKLVMQDKNKLLLLNMVSGHMNVEPSGELIDYLLNDKDELNQNIGFTFLTRHLDYCFSRIEQFNNSKKMGIRSSKQEIQEIKKNIESYIQYLEEKLLKCDKKTKVSLIVNYILINNRYPKVFAYWLMDVELQGEFIIEINKSKKLRTLKEIYTLLFIISKTKIRVLDRKKVSRVQLYESINNVIIGFIQEGNGIYKWEREEQEIFLLIVGLLPVRQKKKLKNFLIKKRDKLMTSKIDELIRFKIYLEDKRKKDIIDGMLAEI
ncbi:hypothetical protein [Clostridium cylindrosporum]|uniref:ATPase n=1 Tax=Clostridium cylindrosporum DSM 605 TaxID=1121307 RepID=A0A0J8G4P4_CLOCY|nr:hypothetical protein [Clostridium cylindrosporum]KMT22646.1 ATPase [Clostridium cylindrosporum DSM 605]